MFARICNKKIYYALYKNIILFFVFTTLSIGLTFLMYSISETTHSINVLKDDFNNKYAFIYLPQKNIVDYFIDNQDENITIYSIETIEIGGISYPMYSVVTDNDFDVILLSNRFERYRVEQSHIELAETYQNYPVIDGITTLNLHANQITLEPTNLNTFLFSKRSIHQIEPENVYLIKVYTNSTVYQKFVNLYGSASDSLFLDKTNPFHVLGGKIYNNSTSSIFRILIFYYIMYLIPAFLFVLLLRQSYKIFLSQSMVSFKINYLFYKSNKAIVLEEFIKNVLIFLINYLLVIVLFSCYKATFIETIYYLFLTLLVVIIVIFYTTNQIVRESIYREISYQGDVL